MFPIAPMGKLLTRLHRLTLAQLRPKLRSTTACTCRRDLENFPMPPWETHVLLVACRAVVSLSMVAQWPSHRLPSVGTQLIKCALILKSSQCPDKKIADVLALTHAFAGRRCLRLFRLFRLFRHGHDNVVLNLREYSSQCACSCSKVPIAPMAKLLTCLPRLTLAQLRTLRSTSGGACHRDLEQSPSPR